MYQWVPLIHLQCPVFQTSTPTAPLERLESSTVAALDEIDTSVLGFTRSVDHRLRTSRPDVSLEVLSVRDQRVGYAYISIFGGIGPCAVRSARYFPSLLARSIQRAQVLGLERVGFVVPGLASTALAFLLEHSARYEADTTLLLSSRPFGRLDRYLLPASDALF